MSQILLEASAPFLLADTETERDAVLLECCTLPDKNLTLTEADLDGIASRFEGNIPVKLQHMDSPLDPFGMVKSVQRVGKQLLGKISFAPAIASFVRERGAVALSCGLERSPLALSEISLVIKGRLPAATLLFEHVVSGRPPRLCEHESTLPPDTFPECPKSAMWLDFWRSRRFCGFGYPPPIPGHSEAILRPSGFLWRGPPARGGPSSKWNGAGSMFDQAHFIF